MLRRNLLLALTLLAVGCSAERRDVLRYFETMQPYFTQFTEVQTRLKQISALPYDDRAAAYRSLADQAQATTDKIEKIQAPAPVASFHQQYANLWRDFATFGHALADVVDKSLPQDKRDKANQEMLALQAAWPAKLKAVLETQQKLGKDYGIDFQ